MIALKGTRLNMDSDFAEPINLGSSGLVSINQLVDIVEEIADTELKRKYNLSAPKGVNGRNSDNTLIQKISTGSLPHDCGSEWNTPTGGSTIRW